MRVPHRLKLRFSSILCEASQTAVQREKVAQQEQGSFYFLTEVLRQGQDNKSNSLNRNNKSTSTVVIVIPRIIMKLTRKGLVCDPK